LAALGSYQRTLELIGIPNAKAIVDVVVLISVASCLNSALYTASRMLYSLSTRRDAMQVFNKTAGNGTPQNAVLGSMVVGFMMVIANYLVPEAVFNVLLATSGAIALLVYMAIAISQLRMRQRMIARGETPAFKMWLFPWLTWAVILFIAAVLVLMAFRPDHQIEVLSTAVLTILLLLVGWVRSRLLGTGWRHSSPALAAANVG
jgi:GABA permease